MLSFVIVLFFLSESESNLAPLEPRSFPAKFCGRIKYSDYRLLYLRKCQLLNASLWMFDGLMCVFKHTHVKLYSQCRIWFCWTVTSPVRRTILHSPNHCWTNPGRTRSSCSWRKKIIKNLGRVTWQYLCHP